MNCTVNRIICGIFCLHGPFDASFNEIKKSRQGLQSGGRQPQPPTLQTEISDKQLKIRPDWRRLSINEMLLFLPVRF